MSPNAVSIDHGEDHPIRDEQFDRFDPGESGALLDQGKGGDPVRVVAGDENVKKSYEYLKSLVPVPSPYLNGLLTPFFTSGDRANKIALWETNRGCPFACCLCVSVRPQCSAQPNFQVAIFAASRPG